ncbi:MAG TPA: IS66 family transposase [Streptosporangiaceae bacterium]|nr:IS66 family transposase [Streptosporangiaceae bacterium]
MPDVLPAPDEVAALRAANARLREVIEAKDTEVGVLRALVEAYQAQLEELRAEVEAPRARLRQNPRNSSRPPSAEGLAKPAPRSQRGKSGRKPGRPMGQPGATLELADHPDEVVTHEPGWCAGCGTGLFGAEVARSERRQVIDLPEEIRALVTEHRIVTRRCGCGTLTSGTAPAWASAPVQYGPRLSAAAAYLWHGQFLSRDRTREALGDLFGVAVSPGAVTGMVTRIAGAVIGCLEAIRRALAAAPAAHFDETGFRVAGKLAWVHSASSGKFALITVHPRRGRQAMDAAGVLPGFTGIAVHDCWAPYDSYGQVTHALCNAHALRELQAVTDAAPPGQWCWATQAADALRDMKHLADASLAIDGTLGHADQAKISEIRHRYHSALLIGRNQTAARAGPLMRKHHALAKRLLAREQDYLRFTADPPGAFR